MKNQRGSLSALTVCIVLSALTLVGLVFDGGRSVSEYTRLSDIAENAARAGAQEITGLRAGDLRLDSRAAVSAGQSYLYAHGVSGTIETSNDSVSVEVAGTRRFQILGIIGLNSQRLRIVRTASVVSG
jgi:Flp pilus assembly protein TadG